MEQLHTFKKHFKNIIRKKLLRIMYGIETLRRKFANVKQVKEKLSEEIQMLLLIADAIQFKCLKELFTDFQTSYLFTSL